MSKKPSYCFIINCASNAFRAEAFFRNKESELKARFPGTSCIYISKDDSITEIARQKAEEHTHIIACGGDGTVNRVANGLVGSNCILGVIPLGSGNDFAQSIGLDHVFDRNVEALSREEITRVDVVSSDWGYFLNTFGIGVDGLTNYYASKSGFKSGFLRYFMGGLKALIKSKPLRTKISISGQTNDIEQEVWMVAVANGKSEGGKYQISPSSINSDGKVELIVVKSVTRVRLIYEFLKLSFGFSFNKQMVDEYSFTDSVSISTEHVLKAHADGEQVPENDHHTFKVLPGALKVITA
ncbi:diacylglycerol/lipid kinase family protein [Gracilimonas sp. BCB1]|uniref:diacylglycerol/lipid kinase family protein n=1 Tax=Gracilimonas sp. BCB1 TaxID=3152362 RepID=UPI0032D99F99